MQSPHRHLQGVPVVIEMPGPLCAIAASFGLALKPPVSLVMSRSLPERENEVGQVLCRQRGALPLAAGSASNRLLSRPSLSVCGRRSPAGRQLLWPLGAIRNFSITPLRHKDATIRCQRHYRLVSRARTGDVFLLFKPAWLPRVACHLGCGDPGGPGCRRGDMTSCGSSGARIADVLLWQNILSAFSHGPS